MPGRPRRSTPAAAPGSAASVAPTASEPSIAYLVGRLDRVLRQAIAEVVGARGLTVPQYTLLSVLETRANLSNAQLARRALVTPQSMSQVLLPLEERGLIRRAAHPANSRVLQTTLTARGRKILAACNAEVADVEAALLAGMSPTEQARLRRMLGQCYSALRSAGASNGASAGR